MRSFTPLGLGFGLACAAACSPASEAAPANAAAVALSAAALDSVKAVDAAFAAAMNGKDTAAAAAIYAADAKIMPPDSPAVEGAAIRPLLAGFIAENASDFVPTPTMAYGVGDLAYVVGTANYKMAGVPETVKYTEVLRRGADGKWRYVVDMFSGVKPPSPAPAAAKKN